MAVVKGLSTFKGGVRSLRCIQKMRRLRFIAGIMLPRDVKLFADAGLICIASMISLYRKVCDACRSILLDGDYRGAYGSAQPIASSSGMYTGGSTPPTRVMSGLVEDFCSLSLGSAPGSFDVGIDPKLLPRLLDGDVEPSSFAGMYPMNCNSRYLQLTTSAIPNSVSGFEVAVASWSSCLSPGRTS